MIKKKQAENIVNAILSELEGRSGFDTLNTIRDDEDVWEELYVECVERVQTAYASGADPSTCPWHPDAQG